MPELEKKGARLKQRLFKKWIVKKMSHQPDIWSKNWYQNFEHLAQWSLASCHFCQVSESDYVHYMKRTSCYIHADDVKSAVQQFGNDFGHLIAWINHGIQLLNGSPNVPEHCLLKPVSLSEFTKIWEEHVCGNFRSNQLNNLASCLMDIHDDVMTKIELFRSESASEYSSYSDYSEDDTMSSYEDEEEEEEEEEKEEGKRPRRKM